MTMTIEFGLPVSYIVTNSKDIILGEQFYTEFDNGWSMEFTIVNTLMNKVRFANWCNKLGIAPIRYLKQRKKKRF